MGLQKRADGPEGDRGTRACRPITTPTHSIIRSCATRRGCPSRRWRRRSRSAAADRRAAVHRQGLQLRPAPNRSTAGSRAGRPASLVEPGLPGSAHLAQPRWQVFAACPARPGRGARARRGAGPAPGPTGAHVAQVDQVHRARRREARQLAIGLLAACHERHVVAARGVAGSPTACRGSRFPGPATRARRCLRGRSTGRRPGRRSRRRAPKSRASGSWPASGEKTNSPASEIIGSFDAPLPIEVAIDFDTHVCLTRLPFMSASATSETALQSPGAGSPRASRTRRRARRPRRSGGGSAVARRLGARRRDERAGEAQDLHALAACPSWWSTVQGTLIDVEARLHVATGQDRGRGVTRPPCHCARNKACHKEYAVPRRARGRGRGKEGQPSNFGCRPAPSRKPT